MAIFPSIRSFLERKFTKRLEGGRDLWKGMWRGSLSEGLELLD